MSVSLSQVLKYDLSVISMYISSELIGRYIDLHYN